MADNVKIDLRNLSVPHPNVKSSGHLNDRLRAYFTRTPDTVHLVQLAQNNNAKRQATLAKHQSEKDEMARLRAQIAQISAQKAQATATPPPSNTPATSAEKSIWRLFSGHHRS